MSTVYMAAAEVNVDIRSPKFPHAAFFMDVDNGADRLVDLTLERAATGHVLVALMLFSQARYRIETAHGRASRPTQHISHICMPLIRGPSAATSILAPNLSILAISSCLGSPHSGPYICLSE